MITRNSGKPKTDLPPEEQADSSKNTRRSLRDRTNARKYTPLVEEARVQEERKRKHKNESEEGTSERKKVHLEERKGKQKNESEEGTSERKNVHLEGANLFERFETLLEKTNNLSMPITMDDLMALHDDGMTKKKMKDVESYQMVSSGYDKTATFYDSTPKFMTAVMRDYQVAGLNWMLSLQKAGLNGILADEMGLGKTIQTISLLAHNKLVEKCESPNLVIVPLSTLLNWKDEVERFCPKLRVFVLHGTMQERETLMRTRLRKLDFDVCLVSYETALKMKYAHKIHFNYVVIDEGHRIKNENVGLSRCIRLFKSNRRLLLTGTPFNNTVREVWALLNYLVPAIFIDGDQFEEYFSSDNLSLDDNIVNRMHRILNPFILRRVKADVEKSLLPKKEYKIYVGFTELQKTWYQKVLSKEGVVAVMNDGSRRHKKLNNIMMGLREVANHPYMFPAAEPSGPPYITDETIVTSCGKMMVLDKMLAKFEKEGSRVLIFSQFTMMLDILEDYLCYREYEYCRFDGNTDHGERHDMVSEFNAKNSKKFVFLMSTRAGGLGINLATADIVIIYDSDWNPQADFQACDRTHRIGQKKQVRVFRLISEKTVDDYIMQTNEHKIRLGSVVIQDRDERMREKKSKDDLIKQILDGSHKVSAGSIETIKDVDIEKLIKDAEERSKNENSQKLEELQKTEKYLVHVKNDHAMYDYSGKNYWGLWPKKPDAEVFEDKLRVDPKAQAIGERALTLEEFWKMFGMVLHDKKVYNFKFYPQRYLELCEKKLAFLNKNNQILCLKMSEKLKRSLVTDVDLTTEEVHEMEELKDEAACKWSWHKFVAFIGNLRVIDKNDFNKLADKSNSSEAEVEKYLNVLWERLEELPNAEKIRENIAFYEQSSKSNSDVDELLAKICAICEEPIKHLYFDYTLENWNYEDFKFLPAEDRYIIVTMRKRPFHPENFQGFFMRELGLITKHWPMRKYPVHIISQRFDYLLEIAKKDGVKKLVEQRNTEDVEKPAVVVKNEILTLE